MIIYLIGLMGSGKSFLGPKIAQKLNHKYIDLDNLIEIESGKSIAEIFEVFGEACFREYERKLLLNLNIENTVISCGGGTACFFNNLEFMKEKGLTVFLNPSLNTLFSRLQKEKAKRPLVSNLTDDALLEKIESLYIERVVHYQKSDLEIAEEEADIIIDTVLNYINTKK